MSVTNEELAGLVLAWAKEHQAEAYAITINASSQPRKYRNCLIRLVELRAAEEKEWRNALPVRVLDETGLSVTVKVKSTGRRIEFTGKKHPNRKLLFSALGVIKQEGLDHFDKVNEVLDLESLD